MAKTINADRYDQMEAFEDCAVDHHHVDREFRQRPGHDNLQFLTARFDEVFTYRALLHAIGIAELLEHLFVIARRKAVHDLMPYTLFQQRRPLKEFVTTKRDFPVVDFAAYTRSRDRYFLAIDHAIALLLSPAIGIALRRRF